MTAHHPRRCLPTRSGRLTLVENRGDEVLVRCDCGTTLTTRRLTWIGYDILGCPACRAEPTPIPTTADVILLTQRGRHLKEMFDRITGAPIPRRARNGRVIK